jgi:hypothetical protein
MEEIGVWRGRAPGGEEGDLQFGDFKEDNT